MKNLTKAHAIPHRKILLWGIRGAAGVLAFGMIGVVLEFIEAVRHPIPEPLLLKAETEDVLGGKIVTVITDDGIKESVTLYAYRSDEKVDSTPSSSVFEHAHKVELAVRDEILPKRTANSRTFDTSVPGTYISEFVSGGPQYHEDDRGAWWQIAYATTTANAFERQLGRKGANIAYAASDEFFPDPDPETTTVDGLVTGIGLSWADARDGVGELRVNDFDPFGSGGARIAGSSTQDQHGIQRLITGFDTSSLGSDSIVSAEYTVNAAVVEDDYGQAEGYVNVVQPAPASNTALAGTDFNTFTGLPGPMTKGSDDDKDLTFMPTGPNTWVLNGTGLTWINGNGITWLGLAEGHDIEDVQITLIDNTENGIQVTLAESPGTADDPKLTVIHRPPFFHFVRKSVDESRAFDDTVDFDEELVFSLEADQTYVIDGAIFVVSTDPRPDFKIAFDAPPGTTIDIGYIASAGINVRGSELLEDLNVEGAKINLNRDQPVVVQISGTIEMGSTGGDVFFMWAQNTANEVATTVKEGSYLRVQSR